MKHRAKVLTSLTLAAAMVASALPVPVLAASDTSGIDIVSETEAPVIEIQDGETEDAIVVTEPDTTEPSTEGEIEVEAPKFGATLSLGSDDGIVMTPVTEGEETQVASSTGTVGDGKTLHVDAFNQETTDADLRLYFWDDDLEVPENPTDYAFANPADLIQLEGLTEESQVSIPVDTGEETVDVMADLVFEYAEDEETVTATYLSMDLPADSEYAFDIVASMDMPSVVTIVPEIVFEDDATSYAAWQLTWEDAAISVEPPVEDVEEEPDDPIVIEKPENGSDITVEEPDDSVEIEVPEDGTEEDAVTDGSEMETEEDTMVSEDEETTDAEDETSADHTETDSETDVSGSESSDDALTGIDQILDELPSDALEESVGSEDETSEETNETEDPETEDSETVEDTEEVSEETEEETDAEDTVSDIVEVTDVTHDVTYSIPVAGGQVFAQTNDEGSSRVSVLPDTEGPSLVFDAREGIVVSTWIWPDEGYVLSDFEATNASGEVLATMEDLQETEDGGYLSEVQVPTSDLQISVDFALDSETTESYDSAVLESNLLDRGYPKDVVEGSDYVNDLAQEESVLPGDENVSEEEISVVASPMMMDVAAATMAASASTRATPSSVTLKRTGMQSYPTGTYRTGRYQVTAPGVDVVGDAYCMDPINASPPDGTYTNIVNLNESEPTNAKWYIFCMLTAYGEDLESVGDNLFGLADQGRADYRRVYIHALIGYRNQGVLPGINADEQAGILNIYNVIYPRVMRGEWDAFINQYTAYKIVCGSGRQDVIFMTRGGETSVTVNKVWSDDNNALQVRPASISVNLYRDNSRYDSATLNAGNNWSYTWSGLETGHTYDVREDTVPSNYTYSHGDMSGNDDSGYSITLTNTIAAGWLQVYKKSGNTSITNGNDCYTLRGATYGVYKNRNGDSVSNQVATLTVQDNDGYTNKVRLTIGTYYVREINPPKGYNRDTQIYTVNVTSSSSEAYPVRVTSTDQPQNDPVIIRIDKIPTGEVTGTMPSLAGAQFTIRYYDGYYKKNNLPSAPTRTWVIETRERPEGSGIYLAQLMERDLVDSLSDDLYYQDGQVVLPLGTISIQETKAPAGFTLNGYLKDRNGNRVATNGGVYVAQITSSTSGVGLQGGNEFTQVEEPKPSNIIIKKFNGSNQPQSGTTYELRNSKGQVVGTATTGSNGIAEFRDLYPDTYTLTEIDTASGLTLLTKTITIKAPMTLTEREVIDNGIDKGKCVYDPVENCYYVFDQTYEITNDVTLKLPLTGATTTFATFLPLIGGTAVFAGSAAIFFKKKRK